MAVHKNPFELRFDILKMAQEIVERPYQEKYNMAWMYLNDVIEKGGVVTPEDIARMVPQPVSADKIKRKAAELYEFVVDNRPTYA